MPKERHPLDALLKYIPANSFEPVKNYIQQYNIQLTITKNRRTVLGDYRPPQKGEGHRISINGGLNQYAFLTTFIHEVAHLITWIQFPKSSPHGKEWQNTYALLLDEFLNYSIFPDDLVVAIRKSQKNPAASSCSEIHLTKALHKYDAHFTDSVFIEQLYTGEKFVTLDGRLFEKGEKRRTRHFGREIASNKVYLFSGIYKVKRYTSN
jgi:SprT protein